MKRSTAGFTLLEMTISMAILGVVSLLSFVAIQGSSEASAVTSAKEQLNADLRETMNAITSEVRQSFSTRTVNAAPPECPPNSVAMTVTNSGKGLRFSKPLPNTISPVPGTTAPITIEWANEDTVGTPNAKLDPSEDKNSDDVLTRRMVRKIGTATEFLGSANTISNVTFTLLNDAATTTNNMNTLRIQLEASMRYLARGKEEVVREKMESTIRIEN